MADAPIQVGDHVINLQMPGIFVVMARRGCTLDLETADGVRMAVSDTAVRRVDAPPPTAAGD
jgi:hypothetical protein